MEFWSSSPTGAILVPILHFQKEGSLLKAKLEQKMQMSSLVQSIHNSPAKHPFVCLPKKLNITVQTVIDSI